MTDHRVATTARVAAAALAVLAVLAGLNTGYVVGHAVRQPSVAAAGAAVATLVVTAALGAGAWRMWRR